MKAIVLGAGKIGRVIAQDLIKSNLFEKLTIADISNEVIDEALKFIGDGRVDGVILDASKYENIAKAMQGYDIAIGALLHKYALDGIKAAIENKINYVDLVGSYPEKRLVLDDDAKKSNVTIIPGCGVAPGLGNILIGYGTTFFDELEYGKIIVGGLPLHKDSPLEYKIVYAIQSVFGIIDRKSKVLINGEVVEEETFSNLEYIEFPSPLGKCEAFLTDGLSYSIYTMKDKGFKRLEEKSVRYPGYVDKVKFLIQCGLLDNEPVNFKGQQISPREFVLSILEPKMRLGNDIDITVLRVEITGKREDKKQKLVFDMMDFRDQKTGITSMARTTGYPCSIAVQMIVRGIINEKGIIPPEIAFGTPERFKLLDEGLKTRGINIDCKFFDIE
ncbi:saccharopine dehydrogenase family protein [Thermovenabulum sp.]|uniref:saccharopine dehydrogenase family protein n=1 Tax=Thermovenabulum sp. TaxID=3100335 RepID=UPI003C7E14AF